MMMDLMGMDRPEEPKRLAPPCYGCSFLCASPFSCTHPAGMVVRWDPIRNHTYRLPSVELVHRTGDLCSFYEPDEERGAEFAAVQRKMRKIKKVEHDKKVDKIDSVLDKLDDENVSIDEFMKELEELADDLDVEEGVGRSDKENK